MSREVSSQSSAVLKSPALASSNVGQFPPFYGAANPASCVGKPEISHFPRLIMAHPLDEPLGTFQSVEQIFQAVAHHNQADIAVPVPRKHRQNPSEVLQKGVDEARPYVPYLMDGYEGRVPTTQGYSEYQAMDTFHSGAGAAPSSLRAKESIIDASRNVKDVANHEAHHRGQSQTKVLSKTSQLNVNAPNFEPGKDGISSIFSFLGNKQAREVVGRESLSFPSSDATTQAPDGASQASKWNVAAPAFKPNAPVMISIPSRDFSFSAWSPSNRPNASAFEPSEIRNASGLISEHNAVPPTKKIFGDIEFSEVIKPSRSKAIPITQPHKDSESRSRSDEHMDGQEDESGRITQADGRQKRLRYVGPHIRPRSHACTLGVVL